VLFIAVPVILLTIAAVLALRFTLTESIVRGIRAELDARKDAEAARQAG